jgi:RNA polymerase sigma factor (sigma-70 family)
VEHSLVEHGSATLLARARAGDAQALEALIARHLPRLRRWASGRVPPWARDAGDTEDLVHDTLVESLKHLNGFEHRRQGALQAYLRQAVLNRVRTQFRRAARRPALMAIPEDHLHDGPSPLEQAIGREMTDRYEAGLASLGDEDREMIVARVEMGYTNDELAAIFEKPSRDAARVAVARALARLAEAMTDPARDSGLKNGGPEGPPYNALHCRPGLPPSREALRRTAVALAEAGQTRRHEA